MIIPITRFMEITFPQHDSAHPWRCAVTKSRGFWKRGQGRRLDVLLVFVIFGIEQIVLGKEIAPIALIR